MTNNTTFAQFERVLVDLGFRKKLVPKTGVAYVHPPTETIVLVRRHKSGEMVPWHVLAATRVQLDGRGVIEATAFDELLFTAAA